MVGLGGGIQQCCFDAIMKCEEPELRAQMFKHIVLAGGGAAFKGLDVRLAKELRFLTRGGVGAVFPTEINVVKPATTTRNASTGTRSFHPDPTVSTWVGGSLMASLGTSGIAPLAKFCVAFPFTYHFCGGLRHVIWDRNPDMLTNQQVEQSSYLVMGAATAISLGMCAMNLE